MPLLRSGCSPSHRALSADGRASHQLRAWTRRTKPPPPSSAVTSLDTPDETPAPFERSHEPGHAGRTPSVSVGRLCGAHRTPSVNHTRVSGAVGLTQCTASLRIRRRPATPRPTSHLRSTTHAPRTCVSGGLAVGQLCEAHEAPPAALRPHLARSPMAVVPTGDEPCHWLPLAGTGWAGLAPHGGLRWLVDRSDAECRRLLY
jgi:hypothetical protein